MTTPFRPTPFRLRSIDLCLLCAPLLAGCGSFGDAGLPAHSPPGVVLVASHANPVAHWHDIAANTVNAKVPTMATASEQYAAFPADMATVHLAVYDALVAIDGRYRPFLPTPRGSFKTASREAAVATAAVGVLRALFPSRGDYYNAEYDRSMAAIPEGPAKAAGVALGLDVAALHVARRAGDGRATRLAPYSPVDAPGRYRGKDPIIRYWPSIRPFTLSGMAQFRPPPPPALDSADYARDFNEVKELGGAASTRRTPEQTETARFHSEAPQVHFMRNFGRFARTTGDPTDAARLVAAIYTAYSDAIGACLEAKYHYDAWRPLSAIPLADTDGNPATVADPAWKPAFATPKHPEYPAAHSCSAGALGELLRQYYGTTKVTFTWDSTVTGTTRTYRGTDALTQESQVARIYGGMHFRYATKAGAELGRQVADWTMQHAFMPQPK